MNMEANVVRRRFASAKQQHIREKIQKYTTLDGWVLERQQTSFADDGTWSNIDSDVTPLERRTWTSFTILGFWGSDALNAQAWEGASSIIQAGLTWRESIYLTLTGAMVDTIPLILNGHIGATFHIPFPVAIRSSFGFYFSRFAVVTRLITALFWHAIQTWTGSTAMFQIIRSIWPSFLDMPNHLPESAGITTNQMVAHFVFWSVQFPILLIAPHKLKWFFVFKIFIVLTVSVAVVIATTKQAGGVGDIWNQPYQSSGSTRSWLIMNSFSSMCGSWATMATNIPDFTRYMKRPRGIYWQALWLPMINVLMATFGMIATSCSKILYGEYLWSPLDLAAEWNGPWGRCGAFWVGFAWVVGQIGTNLSANVISCSNDMTNLCPKYINIRRGVIITTVTAGWIMVPWKIVASASSLLTFMSGLSTFLAPIAAILAADYWIVKRRRFDVPALYRRYGRYRYIAGINWRAAVSFLVSVTPNMPGLANAVNPSIQLSAGIRHIWEMNYLWGFSSAFFLYCVLSHFFPAKETLVKEAIHGDMPTYEGTATEVAGTETASESTDRKEPYDVVGFYQP
ncbi:putative allantoin permease [Talaromyces proteolyticus]|uniref:Allantoin permease n=1 Tax=Talaromyces proteolyticus TaxID=1131652 RepID=A0AAD4KFH6_9EURO|nr:putative allantoin permease [Talaromyces proteolyticus]KAH8689069.1 putative allantoin permease [Talaromyces proteolyticus]